MTSALIGAAICDSCRLGGENVGLPLVGDVLRSSSHFAPRQNSIRGMALPPGSRKACNEARVDRIDGSGHDSPSRPT
jgi:hypothetical protein